MNFLSLCTFSLVGGLYVGAFLHEESTQSINKRTKSIETKLKEVKQTIPKEITKLRKETQYTIDKQTNKLEKELKDIKQVLTGITVLGGIAAAYLVYINYKHQKQTHKLHRKTLEIETYLNASNNNNMQTIEADKISDTIDNNSNNSTDNIDDTQLQDIDESQLKTQNKRENNDI